MNPLKETKVVGNNNFEETNTTLEGESMQAPDINGDRRGDKNDGGCLVN